MSPKPLALLLFSYLLSSGAIFADSLTLKNGRQIKGDIISNTPDSIVIEYFVTPTIKDQKTFSRDEIAKIETVSEDEKAYLTLGSRATPPTVLDSSFYDLLIEKKIPEFINQFPYSRHITELREDLRSLTEERLRVRRGDCRIDGVWISSEQIAADPYQTQAKIKFNGIKQDDSNNDPVSALQDYELLEKNYPGATVFPEALDLALLQLDKVQDSLSTAKRNFDTLDKRRQKTLAVAPSDQAKEIKDALERENQAAKKAIMNAGLDGSKFYPVFPNNKEALDSLQALITSESARLLLLQKIPMRDSLTACKDAARLIVIGKLKEAQGQLDAAAKLWPANAEVVTLKQQIVEAAKKPAPSPSHANS